MIQKRARLDERSVQAVARGDVDPIKKPRRKAERHPAKTFRNDRVDKRVMDEVKRLNPGSRYRVVFESTTSALITNQERTRKFS